MQLDIDRQWASCEAAVARRSARGVDELRNDAIAACVKLGQKRRNAERAVDAAIERGADNLGRIIALACAL